LQRYVLKHQQGGAIGVHIVFDNVGKLEALPKVFERQGRGEGTLCTHTPEETHLKIHTLQETHTPEEMYSEMKVRKMQTMRMKIKGTVWPWKLTTLKLMTL